MTDFLNSPWMQDIITVLAVVITSYLHRHKPQIQQEVAQILPPEVAKPTNDLLDLIDQVTRNDVIDANTLMVNKLKQHGLFTPDTAKAVKQSVMDSVLSKFPDAPDTTQWIVDQLIEKHVAQNKAP